MQAVAWQVMWPDFSGLDIHADPTDFNDLQVLGGRARIKAQRAPTLGRSSASPRQAVTEAAKPAYRTLPQRGDIAMKCV